MNEQELNKIENALSLVDDSIVENVLSNYLNSYDLPFEPTRENAMDILETAFDIQQMEEGIDFEYFYDVLTEFIEIAVSENLHPEC